MPGFARHQCTRLPGRSASLVFGRATQTHVDSIRSLQTRIVEFLDLLPSHDLRTHRLTQQGKKQVCRAMYGTIMRHLDNKYSSRGLAFAALPYSSDLSDEHILSQLHAEIRLVLSQSNSAGPATPDLIEGLRKTAILNQEDYWLRAASIVFVKVRAVFGRSRTNIVIKVLTPELLAAANVLMESSHRYAVQGTWPDRYRDNGMLRLMAVEIRSQFVRMPPGAPEQSYLQTSLRRSGELRNLLYRVSAATAAVNGIGVNQPLYVRTDDLLTQIQRDLRHLVAQPASIDHRMQPPAHRDSLATSQGPSEHQSRGTETGRTQQEQESMG